MEEKERLEWGKGIMQLCNENPTITEKRLFKYYGLYIVECTHQGRGGLLIRYAPVHTDNTFSTCLEVEDKMVEWDKIVEFDTLTETVFINGYYDIDEISLIFNRMKELSFKEMF